MIDLHVHTIHSDGKYTASEILKIAESKNIRNISFCDHDKLGAYDEIKKLDVKNIFSGKIIPGIEFSFAYKKKVFHMLGYNFNIDKLKKSKFIDRRSQKELIECEEKKLIFFKDVCKKLNIKLSPNLKIHTQNEQANDIIKEDMQKYEENGDILDELLGKNREISFWRGHVTNPESPFFIDLSTNLPSAIDIANEIHNAGGIVVLPHVFEYKTVDNKEFLNDMFKLGILDGIECVHSKHNLEQVQYLKEFCKNKDLLMSGGSDFHNDKNQILGYTQLGPIDDIYCLKKCE